MYLRQIELENFKSFGGKVTIPLMEGYMAITGPNGSGKSNIGDAILFVLGPKSPKAVRAGRITDLIFNGGGSRPRAKSMTVSLVFENSDRVLPWDADEVRLTRYVKLSENGDDYTSYFYINDQKSTLSEFDSLLTKARISADGYNIVQQGDVTRIVQMGNIERRRIIDGISGISSFDADIAKAQEQKAEISENLNIANVLLEEKDKQVKALEKQKAIAQTYVDTKATLDTSKAQLVVRQRDREAGTLANINEFIVTLNKQLEQLKSDKQKAVEEHSANEADIVSKEKEIEAKAGPEYTKIKEDVENAKISLATEKDRKSHDEEEIANETEYRDKCSGYIEDNRRQYQAVNENLKDLQIQFEAADAEYAEARDEENKISEETSRHGGELTELQSKVEALDKQIDEASAKDQEAQAASASASAVLEHAKIARAEAEEALNAAQFDVKDAEWNLNEIKKAVGPIQSDDLGKKILELKKQESELEHQESNLVGIYESRNREFIKLSTEKKVTEHLNAADEAIARIMACKDSGQIPGIHGTIAQLAKVEPGYEVPLTVAAGGKMQAVVVDNDEIGKKCIEFLKSNQLARLTFLPLSKMIPGKPRAKAIMVLNRTEGYATDFLEYAPEYTNAFWYVFQDTLVVSTIDKARELMGGIRMVTREGELFEASGAMVGGSLNKRNLPKFGPTAQGALDEAAASVKNASEALESVRSRLQKLREEIRETDSAMRQAGSKDIEARGKLAAAQATLEQAKKALTVAQDALSKKGKECDDAEKDAERKKGSATASAQSLEGLRNERTAARDRISQIAPAGLQERIQKIRDKVFICSQTVSDLSTQITGAKTEIAGIDKQKESYDLQIAEIDKKLAALKSGISEHDANIENFSVTLEALKKILGDMEAGIEGLKNEKDALIEKRYKLDSQINKAQGNIENKQGVIASQTAQAAICQQNLKQLEEEVKAITIEIPEPIPSEETLKRTIRTCEEKIASLGAVNVQALTDYDERKKEYDACVDQIKELNKNIKELDNLTADLTSKKKGLFMKSYDAVHENFKEIYAELSGGGVAKMSLDNEEDPFSGGLQINAKPRNGTLGRLEALSGGEKSLTALSFIFAIQACQPSPFYVLDEVDMFLDAVNSEMVAKRVKKSSETTQFIQVSLRKVTLTMADHLIGVTRPPNGISRVIMQPDLNEVSKYEEEALKKQNNETTEG